MDIIKRNIFKVFVGSCDTYESEDYAFIGSWTECNAYITKWGYEKQSYIEPAGYTRTEAVVGLCKGRHEIYGLEDYIFDNIDNPMDFDALEKRAYSWVGEAKAHDADLVVLYVTGFTPALTSVIKACANREISLLTMHYDRDTNDYKEQYVL